MSNFLRTSHINLIYFVPIIRNIVSLIHMGCQPISLFYDIVWENVNLCDNLNMTLKRTIKADNQSFSSTIICHNWYPQWIRCHVNIGRSDLLIHLLVRQSLISLYVILVLGCFRPVLFLIQACSYMTLYQLLYIFIEFVHVMFTHILVQ